MKKVILFLTILLAVFTLSFKVDAKNDLIAVKGAVPGPGGVFVSIVSGVKAKMKETK